MRTDSSTLHANTMATSSLSQSSFSVGDRSIGAGHPCFVIAEAGVNHNGRLDLAHRLVDVAADVGADAVKFQAFITALLATRDAPDVPYQVENSGGRKESQFEMLQRLELDEAAHQELFAHAKERNIVFISTPDEIDSAQLLHRLGVKVFKIGSPDLVSIPFLDDVAKLGLPVILSTGMGTTEEIETALRSFAGASPVPVSLLHCVSQYPAPPREMNLRAIHALATRFGVPVGLSDHTLGTAVSTAAVALGATIIEKHLTLDTTMEGPDHPASLDPDGFARLVREIREVEAALGDGMKRCMPCEAENRVLVRKSVGLARAVAEGAHLTRADLCLLRPGNGMPPETLYSLVGKRMRRSMPECVLLQPSDVD